MTTKTKAEQGVVGRRWQLADGTKVSTRSSKPRLRKIAKRLARRSDKRAGVIR